MPRCTPAPALESVNCAEPLPFTGDFPRKVPPGDARLSWNSTLPAVTGVPPECTEAVNVSLDPTVIAALETPRLIVVGVCPPAEPRKGMPSTSIRTGIEPIDRVKIRKMEAEFTP